MLAGFWTNRTIRTIWTNRTNRTIRVIRTNGDHQDRGGCPGCGTSLAGNRMDMQ